MYVCFPLCEKGDIAFFFFFLSLSGAFYCCGNIQLESLKLFPVEKYNHFLRDVQTHILLVRVCVCACARMCVCVKEED